MGRVRAQSTLTRAPAPRSSARLRQTRPSHLQVDARVYALLGGVGGQAEGVQLGGGAWQAVSRHRQEAGHLEAAAVLRRKRLVGLPVMRYSQPAHVCGRRHGRVSVDSNEHLCTLQRRDAPPRPSPRQAPATALRPWRRTWRAWPARGNCERSACCHAGASRRAPSAGRPPCASGASMLRAAWSRTHQLPSAALAVCSSHLGALWCVSSTRDRALCLFHTHLACAGCVGARVRLLRLARRSSRAPHSLCSGGPVSLVSRRLSRRRARHSHPPGTEASLPAPRWRRPSRLGQVAGQQQQQRWWRRRTLRGCPYRQPAPTACGSCPHLTWASSSG